ncbi:alpha/beta hydrolase [Candidatus Nitrosocosmicus hydrocola]|jgi:acetyl esterase|uniref:alpha/beta hydrolase n=1 Tax=Candidatus Nitrosocosmicus hydrocola TaxID=1826872 RepID=UPI000A653A51|nr:alpha/beta hydrolase [Candidatus Nitrosocosmicus hydrocola]
MSNFDYSTVEQNTLKFLKSLQGPPLYTLTPKDARAVLSGVQSNHDQIPPADVEDHTIPNGLDGEISLKIVRPRGSKNENLPVVMYFHGGGWVLGGFDTHQRLLSELANGAHAAIVYVNYSPSPEAKYPTSIEEAYSATKWIAENGQNLNLDTAKIAVAGDSVGGNMATVVVMLAKERNGPTIIFQLLFYPVTDASFDTDSYIKYQEGFFLTRDAMKWFWNNYLSSDVNRKDPTISPLQASIEQISKMPRTLIIVGENDVLRDEGEAYAHKLMQAGVQTTATRYLGTIHDFVMLNPVTNTPAARGAIKQALEVLKEVLSS